MAWRKKTIDRSDNAVDGDWRQRVSAHEAGHCVLAWSSPYVSEVSYVLMEMKRLWPDQTLLAGLTAYAVPAWAAEDPRHHWNQIVIGLGGMAGEAFMLKSVKSLGCTVDLAGAKGYAELIARRHGRQALDWLPWPDHPRNDGRELDIGEMFAGPVDPTVRDILNACCRRARTGVALYPDKLAAVMTALLSYDRLGNDMLQRLLGPRRLWC